MKRTLLIVDDDPLICKQLEKELKRNFFYTYIANTGKKALEILNENKIEILLIDIRMPDIQGLELLQIAKKKWVNCEVIIITGYSSQKIAIEALRMGAIDYLEKPINLDELKATLGRAIEKLAEKEDLIYRNTILVVDDDTDIIKKIKISLEKEEYVVFVANNGSDGLKIIDENKIDVILTDINMPVMDGIEFLEKVKKIYRDIEVIMITGYGDEELAVKSLRKGAFNYLGKPINLEELLIVIKKAIEKIVLYRNQLYRNRELKINAEIISKMNEELEKKIEQRTRELSQTQTQLIQTSKLATLGEMSAGLAHELNQPLTGISLSVTTLKRLNEKGLITEEEIQEITQDIDVNVKRMNSTITHIRTFARQDVLKLCRMNVNESINNALKLLREQLRLHEIEVIRELNNDLPMITGEPYQIEQVCINTISNARDALDEKGKWKQEEIKNWSKKLEIKTFLKGDWVYINITDNGAGMSDETRHKIFEPFFTTKEVGKATGLGMSISYGIIQNHKGKIDVESEHGKGTTVLIKLPLKIEEDHTF